MLWQDRSSDNLRRSRSRKLMPPLDSLESRCLLSGYDVTLNSPYEVGTSIAGQSQAYTDVADFQATDPSGNPVTTPAGFTTTIYWGDGTTSTGDIEDYPGVEGLFEVNGNHAYPNPSNGEYNVQVELTDPDGGEWYADPSTATVDPRPDDLSSTPVGTDTFSVTAGQPLAGEIATVTIPDPNLTVTGLTGEITNNTDGTTTPANIVPEGPGTWGIYDTEDFKDPGTDTISIQIQDHQGDSTFLQGRVTVNAPTPTPIGGGSGGGGQTPGDGGRTTVPTSPQTPPNPTAQNPPPALLNPLNFNKRLTWNDYDPLSRPPNGKPFDAYTLATLGLKLDGRGKWTVSVVLVKNPRNPNNSSWVLPRKESPQLLGHEQGHFDIEALAGRDFLNELQGKSVEQEKKLVPGLDARTQSMQSLYDLTTKHGTLAAQQQLWTQEINSLKSSPTGTFTQLQQWAQNTFP
jgi:hypothetical protein